MIDFILFNVRLDEHNPFGTSISILGFEVKGSFESNDTKAKLIKFLRHSIFVHDFSRITTKSDINYIFKLEWPIGIFLIKESLVNTIISDFFKI